VFTRSDFYQGYLRKEIMVATSEEDSEPSSFPSKITNARSQRNLKNVFENFLAAKLYLGLIFLVRLEHCLLFPRIMLKKSIPSMTNHTKTVSMIMTFNMFFIIGKKLAQYRPYYDK
jgi:hypothetical protein